jgi:hypothetical protein
MESENEDNFFQKRDFATTGNFLQDIKTGRVAQW